jgi:putative SOS response-associated peptidase YedK
MCGRFTFAYEDWSEVIEYFGLHGSDFTYPQRYNVAPGQMIPVVISGGSSRRIGVLKWGLIPSWSKQEKTSFKTINCRVETMLDKPSFAPLVKRRRCLIPATGFIEWHRNTKKPMHIQLQKRKLFVMAGLYDIWQGPNGEKVSTCTIITCRPNIFMSPIHDRMPVIPTRYGEDLWLDRNIQEPSQLMHILQPYDGGDMKAYNIDPAIGNVKNDYPSLLLDRLQSQT